MNFHPRHTLTTVAAELAAGLRDGSIHLAKRQGRKKLSGIKRPPFKLSVDELESRLRRLALGRGNPSPSDLMTVLPATHVDRILRGTLEGSGERELVSLASTSGLNFDLTSLLLDLASVAIIYSVANAVISDLKSKGMPAEIKNVLQFLDTDQRAKPYVQAVIEQAIRDEQ